MNRMMTVAVLALAWFAVDCSAAPPEGARGKGPREGGPRAGGPREGGPREGGPREGGPREGGPRGGGPRGEFGGDPAQIVARMMQEFDKDGDQKLDVQELTALMTSMRERRAAGGGARPGRPDGRDAGQGPENMRRRPGGDGKRMQGGGEKNRPGGEKPKRPAAE